MALLRSLKGEALIGSMRRQIHADPDQFLKSVRKKRRALWWGQAL
jgi:hypothetical protein